MNLYSNTLKNDLLTVNFEAPLFFQVLENDLSSGTILNTTNYWFIQNNTIMSNSSLGRYNELSKTSDTCEDSNRNILIIDSSPKKFSTQFSNFWNSYRGSISLFFAECRETKRRCFVSNKKNRGVRQLEQIKNVILL